MFRALRAVLGPQHAACRAGLQELQASRVVAGLAARQAVQQPPRRFKQNAPRVEGLKYYKPTSAGFRGRVIVSREGLHKGKPFGPLTKGMRKTGGRDNTGQISMRHRGGGHKRRYRMVDFQRPHLVTTSSVVERLEYDPNRSARIALVNSTPDADKPRYSYIIAPDGLKPGDVVQTGDHVPPETGNCLPLKNVPLGRRVHNIELHPGKGGQLCRSAGASAELVRVEDGYALLRLPSKDLRLVRDTCKATIGVVSNKNHNKIVLGKAGASRWLGRRPIVRGVVMNPNDHPHGGGTAHSTFGKGYQQSKWGKRSKWIPTRPNKQKKNPLIVMDYGDAVRQGRVRRKRRGRKDKKKKKESA